MPSIAPAPLVNSPENESAPAPHNDGMNPPTNEPTIMPNSIIDFWDTRFPPCYRAVWQYSGK